MNPRPALARRSRASRKCGSYEKGEGGIAHANLHGRELYTRFGFRELIHTQAADIVSPDMAKAGGLAEGKRIAEMADLYYMLAPHNICGPIGTKR